MKQGNFSLESHAHQLRVVKPKNGGVFNPSLDVWKFKTGIKDVVISFEKLNISIELKNSFKNNLVWYFENHSPSYGANVYYYFVCLLKFLQKESLKKIEHISSADILSYKASLGRRKEYYLGGISGFLKRWNSLKLPGLDENISLLLDQVRIRGNLKGEAVLTMDSCKGPFTGIELSALHKEVKNRYLEGQFELEDYCLVLLFISFGVRPVQCALMKIDDLRVETSKTNESVYFLRIPSAKKRTSLRSVFNERALLFDVGESLLRLCHKNRQRYSTEFKDPNDIPLFPSSKNTEVDSEYRYHKTSTGISAQLFKALSKIHVISERTGKKLVISAIRFRRTIGTLLAEEGHGPLVIAEALDHSDTQNVGVYIEATPKLVKRIDKAVAAKLAPLAQAFKGTLIENESQGIRKADSPNRVYAPKQTGEFKPIACCSSSSLCHSFAPIACYTCSQFQPWIDAPHEKVLQYLLSERERLLKSSDARIASINDLTILAVEQVIQLCNESKKKRNE